MSEQTATETIHAAIQETLHRDEAGETQGNVVTGWVLVAESMDSSGHRWLSKMSGSAGGDNLTEWAQEGLMHNALYSGGWDFPIEDEDDA